MLQRMQSIIVESPFDAIMPLFGSGNELARTAVLNGVELVDGDVDRDFVVDMFRDASQFQVEREHLLLLERCCARECNN